MKYVLPLSFLATPALAHSGAHLHPHGYEPVVMGLILLAVAVIGFGLRSAKQKAKK